MLLYDLGTGEKDDDSDSTDEASSDDNEDEQVFETNYLEL